MIYLLFKYLIYFDFLRNIRFPFKFLLDYFKSSPAVFHMLVCMCILHAYVWHVYTYTQKFVGIHVCMVMCAVFYRFFK